MGVLRARVGGQWVDVASPGGQSMAHGYANLAGINPTQTEGPWGAPVTIPVPVGSTNVPVSVSFIGYAQNFSSPASGVITTYLDYSVDGGVNWIRAQALESVPFGQTGSPVINRTPIAINASFTIGLVTVAPQVRIRILDASHTSGTSTSAASLQWWVGAGSMPGIAVPVSPSQPLGVVAMGALTGLGGAALASGATVDVTAPLSFMAQLGRRYRMVCRLRALSGVNTFCYLRPFGGTVNPGDVYRWLVNTYDSLDLEAIFDGNGIQSTYKVTLTAGGAGINYWTDQPGIGSFYIEDIGPNQTPALPLATTPPPWTAVTLAAPWSNIGGTSQTLQYRKIGDMVHIRGEIRFTTPGGNPMFILPPGFRPPGVTTFPLPNRTANPVLTLTVNPDGVCNINGLTANADFALGTILFSTTA